MSQRLIVTSVVSLVVALSGAACTSEPEETGADFINEYCSIIGECCAEEGYPFRQTTCLALLAFASSGATYDAEAGRSCLDWTRSAGCARLFGGGIDSSDSDVCQGIFTPSSDGAAPGESCESRRCAASSEGDVACVSGSGGSERTCQVTVVGKEGDFPCFYDHFSSDPVPPRIYECGGDLYCDYDSKKCARKGAIGEPCGLSFDACIEGATCMNGICAALAKAGESCEDAPCGDSLYCAADQRCAPRKAEGEPCSTWTECASRTCEPDGTCAPSEDPGPSSSAGLACGLLGGDGGEDGEDDEE